MTILRTMRNFSSMNITASILLFLAAISQPLLRTLLWLRYIRNFCRMNFIYR